MEVDPGRSRAFRGEVTHHLEIDRPTRAIRLHAADLRVSRPLLCAGSKERSGRIVVQPKLEMIDVHFDRPVPAGAATLRLAFSGRLRADLCGLYGVEVGERRYAFSQLEATDARKFFPCFDEPAMKARFRISVTTDVANSVVSNAPAIRTRPFDTRRKTVQFAETPPLSTYLVALAVGDLERSRPVRVGPTEIRVWHTPGKQHLTRFGLEAARECLARLERYFGLPYPYAKLDLVAVPDFEFGAMENAGAVFFRETLLLLDPATATLGEQKRAAEVIAHELAHMWYGNLVTMAWWDDLWLNEAFATWMAFAIVDDWKPEWRMWRDFQHGRAAALELDALNHSHPIYCPVRTAAEASENFDLITYEKGASVVRMIERYLGAGAFRRGVRTYIRRHREGNTVAADLWRALSEASGEPVESIARAWIEREGYPVLTVRRGRAGRRSVLRLRQDRFTTTPGAGAGRRASGSWPIPWVARVGSGRRGRGRLERRLVTRARDTVTLSGPAPRFVYGNADESGFFRPLHGGSDFRALLESLASLTPIERMGLVDHQWALACAARAPLASFLDLADSLRAEREADVLSALYKPLIYLSDHLIPNAAPDCRADFETWVEGCFAERFDALGWKAARGEADDVRLRRAALLRILGHAAAPTALLREASARCDLYLDDRRAIEANLADSIVSLAACHGDSNTHDRFALAAVEAGTPQEQRRFLLALGDFTDPKLVDRTLALTLTDAVATQDVIFLLTRLLANPAARERTWRFVQHRWPTLKRRIPSLLASRFVESTWHLLTPGHRREVARFFREHPIPSGERALRQTLERFDWYRGFRRGAARELGSWLGRR